MAKTIEDLFFYLVFVFDLLIITQVIFTPKSKAHNRILWLLLGYCTLNSVCNFLQQFILPDSYQYIVLAFFTISEYLLLASVFFLLIKSKKFHKVIITLSFIFLVVVGWSFNRKHNQMIDAVPIGVETIFILIYSFYYLYEQMNIVDDSFIYNRYHFWMVIGIMLYLGGSFFIYIFTNQAQGHVLDDFWFLTYVFYILKNIFFAIGISYYSRKARHQTAHHQYRPYLN